MAKHKGEPVGWVTVDGKHIPKWKDGSIGWDNDVEEKKDTHTFHIPEVGGGTKEIKDAKILEKSTSALSGKPVYKIEYTEGTGRRAKTVQKWVDADTETAGGKEKAAAKREHTPLSEQRKRKEPDTIFEKEYMDKVNRYREKFLTKRTDEEIAEIKKNLDTSSKFVGTTEQDMVAYKAIEDEMARRKNSGVTRKDVEELTAKKDSLKGVDLKTKPITPEEISEAKKRMEHTFKKKETTAPAKISDKSRKVADNARKSLIWDNGRDYVEIAKNQWQWAGMSNEAVVKALNATDDKYTYEYKQDQSTGAFMMPNAKVNHYKIYRKKKK